MPDERSLVDDPSSSVHSTLLRLVRDRDPEAWRRLVHIYGPLVYQWCRSRGLQPSDAADVMQAAFHAAAANIGQFEGSAGAGSFRAWLWTIARNKLRDFYRHQARQARGHRACHRAISFRGR